MKLKLRNIFLLVVLVLFFQACSLNQDTFKSVAKTNSAIAISEYKNEVLKTLVTYKKKLDLRNPYSFNKNIQKDIYQQINAKQDYINIIQKDKKLKTSDEYLYHAFSKESIQNRNDFLILGIYKLIYKAYSLDKVHTFSAMEHNKYEILKLYKYLQVIRWKIRTQKDLNNEYLFITWQNNWQLELMKKDNSDLNIIKDLKYIKSKKETIYSPSNFSFETLISQMLTNIEHSLRKINIEPYEMSISALKSFVFII